MLTCCLGADAHIAVEGCVNIVLLFCGTNFFQLRRNIFSHSRCRTDISGDVVSAKHMVDQDVVGIRCRGIGLAVDVYEGAAAHIGHTGAAEHLALRIFQRTCCLRVENSTDIAGFHRHFRRTVHHALVAAAIHVTPNLNLPLCHNRAQKCKCQYGNNASHSQTSNLKPQISNLNSPPSSGFPDPAPTAYTSRSALRSC